MPEGRMMTGSQYFDGTLMLFGLSWFYKERQRAGGSYAEGILSLALKKNCALWE
jgi:hypothetical protein